MRAGILLFAIAALGCAESDFAVASSDETAVIESADSAPTDSAIDGTETSIDAAPDVQPDTFDAGFDGDTAPPGVGLPCTSSKQCAPYGLTCISSRDPTCDGVTPDCPHRYNCEPRPAFDKCSPPTLGYCVDIACTKTADCPVGDNFCVGVLDTSGDSCAVTGFLWSYCSSGKPASDPKQVCNGDFGPGPGPYSCTNTVFTCGSDADCIMDDGAGGTYRATCCSTAVGIRYCASTCTLK